MDRNAGEKQVVRRPQELERVARIQHRRRSVSSPAEALVEIGLRSTIFVAAQVKSRRGGRISDGSIRALNPTQAVDVGATTEEFQRVDDRHARRIKNVRRDEPQLGFSLRSV